MKVVKRQPSFEELFKHFSSTADVYHILHTNGYEEGDRYILARKALNIPIFRFFRKFQYKFINYANVFTEETVVDIYFYDDTHEFDIFNIVRILEKIEKVSDYKITIHKKDNSYKDKK